MSDVMAGDESLLWGYIDEESDALMLELKRRVEVDGFKDPATQDHATETIVLKVLAATQIKVLAMLTEKMNHPNIAMAYLQIVPLQTELIKLYLMKELKAQGGVE